MKTNLTGKVKPTLEVVEGHAVDSAVEALVQHGGGGGTARGGTARVSRAVTGAGVGAGADVGDVPSELRLGLES